MYSDKNHESQCNFAIFSHFVFVSNAYFYHICSIGHVSLAMQTAMLTDKLIFSATPVILWIFWIFIQIFQQEIAVSWKSKKQSIVTTPTDKINYCFALESAALKCICLSRVFKFAAGFQKNSVIIPNVDSQKESKWAKNDASRNPTNC